MRRTSLVGLASLLALAAAGCGAQPQATPSPSTHGVANVAYAGSLQDVNDTLIGPAFQNATGNTYQGQGGGSVGIAQEIRSKTILPNVFESIGYAPVQIIEPSSTRWALAFAASPLVVAYNPHSPFSGELNAIKAGHLPIKDLFTLMANPAFHLGRTNPNTDPQGQAFYMMVELAVKQYGLPSGLASKILGPIDNPHQVYSEEGILTLLQSGGLDASSAFLSEAIQRHLDYIALPASLNFAAPSQGTWYHTASLTLGSGKILHGAPLTVDLTTVGKPAPAAVSFIQFVLGSEGARIMKRAGYTVFRPEVLGTASAIPQALQRFAP